MPLLKEPVFTAEDYWNQPEGKRAELIDGQLYDMAPPNYIHQKLISKFKQKIGQYITEHNGNCKVLPAPFAVNLNADDRTWVEPDISIICDKHKLSERGCEGAPDWIIEITSPRTQNKDYGIKLFKYRNADVREYWIVNPLKKTVNVFDFEKNEGSRLYSFDEDIPAGIYSELLINIADLLS